MQNHKIFFVWIKSFDFVAASDPMSAEGARICAPFPSQHRLFPAKNNNQSGSASISQLHNSHNDFRWRFRFMTNYAPFANEWTNGWMNEWISSKYEKYFALLSVDSYSEVMGTSKDDEGRWRTMKDNEGRRRTMGNAEDWSRSYASNIVLPVMHPCIRWCTAYLFISVPRFWILNPGCWLLDAGCWMPSYE